MVNASDHTHSPEMCKARVDLDGMERGDAPSGRDATFIARVEVAVGMLMELRGWDSSTARAHLILAAQRAETPVAQVATALLILYDEPR